MVGTMADPTRPDPGMPDPASGRRRRRVVRRVRDATRRLVESAEDLAGTVGVAVTESAGEALSDTIGPAAEAIGRQVETRRYRWRVKHRPSRIPLPNLYRVHPEARFAAVREVGLLSIPVDEIRGTAVEGIDQRGVDFRPMRPFRSPNWKARWLRLVTAAERLETLPPIDVLRMPDGYWVTDGHNRVGIAKALGQVEIDADVRAVVLPGQERILPSGSLAPVLANAAELHEATRGRYRATSSPSPKPHPSRTDEPGTRTPKDPR